MRVGLFGGTFNPIHYGHLRMAKRAIKAFHLDKCLMVVANTPPHKSVDDNVPAAVRYKMAEDAVAAFPCSTKNISASDIELSRGGISYSVDTLRMVSREYPGAQLYLIVGADTLLDMRNWHKPNEVFELANIIAVHRKTKNKNILEHAVASIMHDFNASIEIARFSTPNISSQEIRKRVFDAKPIAGLTPYPVERYIYEQGLYQPPDIQRILERLKQELNPKRYIHSASTMRESINLAERHDVDPYKCRLAGLLHDCAKVGSANYLEEAHAHNLHIDKYEYQTPGLLHAKLGEIKAREVFGIDDEEILLAIRNHTLCRADMTDVEKVTYVADKIEALRDCPGVEALRESAQRSLDGGVLACMDHNIHRFKISKSFMHPSILSARRALLKYMRH